jgi:capsid protein
MIDFGSIDVSAAHDLAQQGEVRRYGYDAVESSGKRRPPKVRVMAEDEHLDSRKRKTLMATNRDVVRNFILASWICRKHLDYVTCFSFRAKTKDEGFNRDLEYYMQKYCGRHRCDIARRHRLQRFMRIAEARRILDGDFGILKIASTPGSNARGKIQGIESELIDTPAALPKGIRNTDWVSGVRLSAAGAAVEYMICKRKNKGVEFGRIVPAASMILHAYFDSTLRHDQVRGVSPFAAAVNTLQDVYEGFDYSLARIKVAQMFGLTITRSAEASLEHVVPTADADGDGVADSKYEIDFGKGPVLLDMDPGDDAKFLENKTPAMETVNFLNLMILLALKALDIPYSFWDESFTNFYGSRGGLIQYIKSCKTKIADNREVLDELTKWRMGLAVEDDEIRLPSGWEFDDIEFEWIPDGVPWWDPVKEVRGHAMAVAAGFSTFDRVVRETSGGDIFDNIEANAKVLEFARKMNYPLALPGVSAFGPDVVMNQGEGGDVES